MTTEEFKFKAIFDTAFEQRITIDKDKCEVNYIYQGYITFTKNGKFFSMSFAFTNSPSDELIKSLFESIGKGKLVGIAFAQHYIHYSI